MDKRSTMVSTIKVILKFLLIMCKLLEKQSVTWETTRAKPLISIMIKMDTIWSILHASVLCLGKKQQVTFITSTIHKAHFWKIGRANSRWRIICWEIDIYWEWPQRIITWWVDDKRLQVLKSLLHLANYQHNCAVMQNSRS